MSLADELKPAPTLVHEGPGGRVWVTDSVAFGSTAMAGDVIITGSHGGTSAGEYAVRYGVAALVANDAGGGKIQAGTAGLRDLDACGILGIATSHESSRIGDGNDVWENGTVSFVNDTAARAGIKTGEPLKGQILQLVDGGEG